MRVRIGKEQAEKSLQTTSLVSVEFGGRGKTHGAIGVLGPTRMDYSGTMTTVNAVARYIGEFISEETRG